MATSEQVEKYQTGKLALQLWAHSLNWNVEVKDLLVETFSTWRCCLQNGDGFVSFQELKNAIGDLGGGGAEDIIERVAFKQVMPDFFL